MHNQESRIRRVAQIKAVIDNGLCRVGPGLDSRQKADSVLIGNASRSVALSDGVVQLCRSDHPNEAVLLLMALAGSVVGLRWVLGGPEAAQRAEILLREMGEPAEPALWPAERLLRRAEEAGLPAADLEKVLTLGRFPMLAGRSGLPWSHVFKENSEAGTDCATVLDLVCRLMDHALQGLASRWPGNFELLS
ncbi:MAG: hypothetical protein WC728_15985 [Elusimicrobiota bacterium]